MADAIRQIGVSEVSFYRWRQEFGGLTIEQVKRLKDLELENGRLHKSVFGLTLSSADAVRGSSKQGDVQVRNVSALPIHSRNVCDWG